MKEQDQSHEFWSGCIAAGVVWTIAAVVCVIGLGLAAGAAYRVFRWAAGF